MQPVALLGDALQERAAVLRVVLCALVSVVSTVFGTWSIAQATTVLGMPKATFLWVIVLANVVALILWRRHVRPRS